MPKRTITQNISSDVSKNVTSWSRGCSSPAKRCVRSGSSPNTYREYMLREAAATAHRYHAYLESSCLRQGIGEEIEPRGQSTQKGRRPAEAAPGSDPPAAKNRSRRARVGAS
eukprot:CAMPEP_0177612504 /NCGR_PEP_ID=MMETSP0419_2-20121207/21269_1 /TAXON_ID=582737 /ORGANISM="Tetraselmis sp., Strain GSL018" /LENGTH=111 /DNA_ID=CAMNT_0019108723 /DNA_START=261 /DNA_END=593 /DNA_ORIENTATION=-